MAARLCKDCGQPMLPRGAVKLPNEYDHARGCPSDPAQKLLLAEEEGNGNLMELEQGRK